MRIIIGVFLAILSYNICLGQQDSIEFRKGYIGVSIGPAIPVGEFSSDEIGNRSAGFAETGLTFSAVNFGYRFKYIELAALLMGSAHFLSQNVPDEEAAWVYSGIFVGSVIPRDISKKVQMGIKVMLGYVGATSPEVSTPGVTLQEQYGNGLGIIGGVNVRYNVFERWCAVADLYYLAANPQFDSYKQNLRAINGAFGIGYRLR